MGVEVTSTSSTRSVSAGEVQDKASDVEKNPPAWRIFPWAGASSLVGSLLSVLASMGILLAANLSSIDRWPVWQPNTYLSVVASATNVMLHFALAEGIMIAWWYRAAKESTTVQELHNVYLYSVSWLESIRSGRGINSVAIATIIIALISVNGPVLQRAVTSGSMTTVKNVTTTIPIITDPSATNWTSAIYGGGNVPAILTPAFIPTAGAWLYSQHQTFDGTGCDGLCTGIVLGNGFEMSCTNETLSYEIPDITSTNSSAKLEEDPSTVLVFNVSITWNNTMPDIINLSSLWKPYPGCTGQAIRRNCTLSAAIIEYPVTIDTTNQNATTIAITDASADPLKTVITQSLVGSGPEATSNSSIYGGLFLILRDKYTSSAAAVSSVTKNTQEVDVTGTLSNYYAFYDQTYPQLACGIYYAGKDPANIADPMMDILRDVRQLTFMTSLDAGAGAAAAGTGNATSSSSGGNGYAYFVSNSTGAGAASWLAYTNVTTTQTQTHVVYFVHWLFYGVSVLITVLCSIAVAPVYNGWWILRRRITLSPIETARAFNAPGLADDDFTPPLSPQQHLSPQQPQLTQQQQYHHHQPEDKSPIDTTAPASTPCETPIDEESAETRTRPPQRSSVNFGIDTEDTPQMLRRLGTKRVRDSMVLHMPVKMDPASARPTSPNPRLSGLGSRWKGGPKSPGLSLDGVREQRE